MDKTIKICYTGKSQNRDKLLLQPENDMNTMNAQELTGWALFVLGLAFSLVPTCMEAFKQKSLYRLTFAPAMLFLWHYGLLVLFWLCAFASFGALWQVAIWMSKAMFIPWYHLAILIS